MMDENPSAFPSQPRDSSGLPCGEHMPGMTLRDYFAGQALAGMLAAPPEIAAPCDYASVAYDYADAMLTTRLAPTPAASKQEG